MGFAVPDVKAKGGKEYVGGMSNLAMIRTYVHLLVHEECICIDNLGWAAPVPEKVAGRVGGLGGGFIDMVFPSPHVLPVDFFREAYGNFGLSDGGRA